MSKKQKDEYVWKDRKRYLGLPLSFTRYAVKDQRLYYTTGFFNTTEEEMLLYRILDIKLNRTLGDKLVGVGTITLYTADKTHPKLELVRIKNPKKVRDLLSKLVENERIRINAQGRELYGISKDIMGFDSDGDGIPLV
ncbi:MAG: PH domain-containing protein [Clostridiaceae bacterium]|nr:PH domain-containing protein [Clostridiaceae bacterium]